MARSDVAELSTAQLWAGARAALKARDLPAVIDFLNVLAPRDPRSVELFMALVAAAASAPATAEEATT